jgi:hypothetical protein
MHTITPMPTVHVTNYQQYINADDLTVGILDHIPADAVLPERLYISIAYMRVVKFVGRYKTNLNLSIKGRSYSFSFLHDNDHYYLAGRSLELNETSTTVVKDIHIRVFQQAFEAVVNKNIKQITKAIITAYEHK